MQEPGSTRWLGYTPNSFCFKPVLHFLSNQTAASHPPPPGSGKGLKNMASTQDLRSCYERPASAGRFSVLRTRTRLLRHLATPLALAAVVFTASQLASYGP